jgi:methylenetetrahydrofolate reductase (NADPH)
MSVIKPSRRWQPAFYPFRREKFGRRLLAKTERLVKGSLFGCRMCGNCLLQETAFICPMECPKGLRNGPCGGTTPSKKCYVDETRSCIWTCIYERALKMGREEMLLEVLPPVDWEKAGTETWGDVARQVRSFGTARFFRDILSGDRERKEGAWDSVFKTIRQPAWWKGDSLYHAPVSHEPVSELERRLQRGEFVVATEVAPPLGANSEKLKRDIELVRPHVAAINFTDSASARPRMSSLACCSIAAAAGVEPVLQVAARDTTRAGLQANIVGLNELSIFNVLCISGDSPVIGPSPTSNMNIFDLDSVQMLWILRRMRDEGLYLDGREMKNTPRLFLGAASSPVSRDPRLQAIRDQKKVNAGAQFFQTNLVFDAGMLDPWLGELDKRNVLDKVYILIGIAPLKSFKVAEYLHAKVPGVTLPLKTLDRMKKAGDKAGEEGINIALELVDTIKNKKGVSGIHIMSLGWETAVARIVNEAGLAGHSKHPVAGGNGNCHD